MESENCISRPWHIALISGTILTIELAFIRVIPAEVKAVSYFTNLILIAAFFGLGLGCILQKGRSLRWFLPGGFCAVSLFVLLGRGIVTYGGSESVHFWLQDSAPEGVAMRLPLFPAAMLAFVAAALPFLAFGQQLSQVMDRFPRLTAYGWDIAGSLIGTIAFSLGSWLEVPPYVWPPIAAGLWARFLVPGARFKIAVMLSGAFFLALAFSSLPSRWSPYYYIQYQSTSSGMRVFVNSSFHQHAIDFDRGNTAAHEIQEFMVTKWSVPYKWYSETHGGRHPESVLVLGAGTGNDVFVALANGAQRVVAVEIDPVILRIGRQCSTVRIYSMKGVETRLDDARHFLETSPEHFDMVVFGTLDSQVLLSGAVNLRLENFVYTREALQAARNVCTDDGMVVLYYSVMKPWLYGRLLATVTSVFGDSVMMKVWKNQFLFNTAIAAAKRPGTLMLNEEGRKLTRGALTCRDDWPFIYLGERTIAPIYWQFIAFVAAGVCIAFVVLRRTAEPGCRSNERCASLLFLGLGFTLVESSSIVRLALLFGSTWIINSIVFSAVLAMIFLANWSVMRSRAPSLMVAWIGVLSALFINYLIPTSPLCGLPWMARAGLCVLLVGTPVYFAAVCFSRLFARSTVTGYALGMNLVGAMFGGVLEYCSMVTGMRAVWLLAMGIYACAWAVSVFPSWSFQRRVIPEIR